MGYIQIFGEKLDALLERHGLPEDGRAEVVAYVENIVLESYKNGLEQGRKEGNGKPAARKGPP